MKTFDEIETLLGKVKYKEGWWLNIQLDYDFVDQDMQCRPYLQWVFWGPCATTGKTEEQRCRKWFLSYHMTDGELVQTAFGAALQAEDHECREFFLFDGHRVMNPHLSLDALVSRAHMTEGRA